MIRPCPHLWRLLGWRYEPWFALRATPVYRCDRCGLDYEGPSTSTGGATT